MYFAPCGEPLRSAAFAWVHAILHQCAWIDATPEGRAAQYKRDQLAARKAGRAAWIAK